MKAVVFTLGCKVNSCESSSLINGLNSLGYETSDELGYADVFIINTCAVTAEAEKKIAAGDSARTQVQPRLQNHSYGLRKRKKSSRFFG